MERSIKNVQLIYSDVEINRIIEDKIWNFIVGVSKNN